MYYSRLVKEKKMCDNEECSNSHCTCNPCMCTKENLCECCNDHQAAGP